MKEKAACSQTQEADKGAELIAAGRLFAKVQSALVSKGQIQ